MSYIDLVARLEHPSMCLYSSARAYRTIYHAVESDEGHLYVIIV